MPATLALVGALSLGLSMVAAGAAASPTKDQPSQSQAGSHSSSGTSGTSGDPASPQPKSNADSNSGGANGKCPGGTYCSTRNGAASQNGNGKGKATGKPCAGCVGKADNKNPPGQEKSSPRTTFPNNGYECDNNNGIGKTNPAHTGCTSPTVVPTSGTTDCTTHPTPAGCTKSSGGSDCTTAATAATAACTGSASSSAAGGVSGGATVLGETFTKVPTVLAAKVPSVGARQVSRTPSALPFTGFNAATMAAVAVIAAVAGLVLLSAAGVIRRPGRSRAHASGS